MTLTSEAQLIVEDFASANDAGEEAPPHIHLGDEVVVYESKPAAHEVLEVHELDSDMGHFDDEPLLDRIPGAPPEAQDELMVEDTEIEIEQPEESDSKKKKTGLWDWLDTHGFNGFVIWVRERLSNIPKHSGRDVAGCERAMSYMERVRDEIRSAMKKDLEGVLDAQAIEHLYAEIDDGILRLQERAESLGEKFKSKKKKKASFDSNLIKEGQKATHVGGIIVTVPLLIHRLARVCINGTVSAGHDIEDLFGKAVKKYSLDNREQAELMQLMSDMGFPLRRDRGYDINEETDSTADGADYAANYQA